MKKNNEWFLIIFVFFFLIPLLILKILKIPMLNLVVGFVLGATAIIVAEAFCIFFFFNRYILKKSNKKENEYTDSNTNTNTQLDHHQESLNFASNKQGIVWALEPEKIPKLWSDNKALKEQKSKKEILEVCPVKKYAKIDDHSLILTDADGSQATIQLLGCTVLSISATNLSSRKWAKRYPIKVERGNSAIYKGSRTCYLYFETSWEKESWSKALRLASCVNSERTNWYAKLSEEFHDYLSSLKAGYPSFMKPSAGFFSEPNKNIRTDGPSSKVRLFLKKLAKKASKSGSEHKAAGVSVSASEERKMGERSQSIKDSSSTGSAKNTLTENIITNHLGENTVPPLPTFTQSGGQGSVNYETDSDEKFSVDEGTLCWNLLISRLFFDAQRNTNIKSSIQARIQRTLSTMRIPSYIGGVTCTSLDVGTLPPYIHSMRVLPTDMNEVWAMEIDIEYSGGAILDIETRLEVREAELEKGIVNASVDSGDVDEVTSDLLEGFEHFGNQLKFSGKVGDGTEKRDEGDNKADAMKKNNSWKSSYTSRWKCILNSIANQVSQVPISLAIKVASVRGTLRLHIKPPPSDQLWFGFTSMPDIDFNLESSVGEHQVSGAHSALLLGNRFKAAIRDTLVLPNCEGVCIPWMLAEKDDWAPQKVAPFMWINQDTATESMGHEVSGCQPIEVKTKDEVNKVSKQREDEHHENTTEQPKTTPEPAEVSVPLHKQGIPTPRSSSLSTGNQALHELQTPLLTNKPYDTPRSGSVSESPRDNQQSGYRSVSAREDRDDGNPKRIGRKARMLDLGKKMGEKLEEKRRHIEEKSRTIVEKMRAP